MAADMVSRSRISPTRITSGAWRRAFLSATCRFWVSLPISRWLTTDFLFLNKNSTGSSIVRMCPALDSLRKSSIDASVVLLPAPVAPTINSRPRFSMISSPRIIGTESDSRVGMVLGMNRITAATEPRWCMPLTRKRPIPASGKPMLSSPVESSSAMRSADSTSARRLRGASGGSNWLLIGRQLPLILMSAGECADR